MEHFAEVGEGDCAAAGSVAIFAFERMMNSAHESCMKGFNIGRNSVLADCRYLGKVDAVYPL